MSEYSDVIAQGPDDLGRTEVLKHHIDTKDAIPILKGSYFHVEKLYRSY